MLPPPLQFVLEIHSKLPRNNIFIVLIRMGHSDLQFWVHGMTLCRGRVQERNVREKTKFAKLLYFGIPQEQEGFAIVHFLHSSFSLFLEVRVFLDVCFNFWLKQYIYIYSLTMMRFLGLSFQRARAIGFCLSSSLRHDFLSTCGIDLLFWWCIAILTSFAAICNVFFSSLCNFFVSAGSRCTCE
jgi:hypothetical protein